MKHTRYSIGDIQNIVDSVNKWVAEHKGQDRYGVYLLSVRVRLYPPKEQQRGYIEPFVSEAGAGNNTWNVIMWESTYRDWVYEMILAGPRVIPDDLDRDELGGVVKQHIEGEIAWDREFLKWFRSLLEQYDNSRQLEDLS